MSSITISGNASGTATFTVQSPATNTNRTITLPDATTTIMGTDTAVTQSQLATVLNASGSAPLYAARAWVNFNGTGTVAIRASGNVTSITDNGTGDYTVNITTAIEDANYAVVGSQKVSNTTATAAEEAPVLPFSLATGSFRIQCNDDQVLTDSALVYCVVFR